MSQSRRRVLYRAKGLPDPGPTPSVELVAFRILVPKAVSAEVEKLYQLVTRHFASRNDFLVELLRTGLRAAITRAVVTSTQEYGPGAGEPLALLPTEIEQDAEDAQDVVDARTVMDAADGPLIPHEEVKRRLGLDEDDL